MQVNFRGVLPAVLTPFANDGLSIDIEALKENVEWLIAQGVHGFYVCGTTGEAPLLSLAERRQIAETVTEQANGRVSIIVHTGCTTTADTIALSTHAQAIGVSAVAVVTPWYMPYDDQSLYEHFAAVASAVNDLPILLYNIPSHARNQVTPELFRRLSGDFPQVIGVKDSSKDLDYTAEYLRSLPTNGTVLVGADTQALPALAIGSAGVVSALANVFPEVMVELFDAYHAGKLDLAKALQERVAALRSAIKGSAGTFVYKYAVGLRGLPTGVPRLPSRGLTEQEAGHVKERLVALEALGR